MHPGLEREVAGHSLAWWSTTGRMGSPYKDLFVSGEMVLIEPGVRDIVEFLNDEMGLLGFHTTFSCEGHPGVRDAYVTCHTGGDAMAILIDAVKRELIPMNKKGYYYAQDGDTRIWIGMRGRIEDDDNSFIIQVSGNKNRGWNEWMARFRRWFGV